MEDDVYLVEFYAKALELLDHKVVGCAYDGNEAIQKFKEFNIKPDIIIMDHRLPLKNGIEAMKEILKLEPSMKIIFASADNQTRATGPPVIAEKTFWINAT